MKHIQLRRRQKRLSTAVMAACLGAMALCAVAPLAMAAPVELARYDFIVSGQEADTAAFDVPAGRNRSLIITVHARTDNGPTADYVTVDWARLDGDAGMAFTKAREVSRSFGGIGWQGVAILYRHIASDVVGDHTIRVRMAENLTEDKVVHVYVMGNMDAGFTPGPADGNDANAQTQVATVNQAADADFLVIDAATFNNATGNLTGRAPASKVWVAVDVVSPTFKALSGRHEKTASGTLTYSYSRVTTPADHWTMATTRFRAAYTIEASANANGAIDPDGDVPVISGGAQAFTIDADENYVISQLLVDGVAVEAAAGEETYIYEFENVTGDHTIEASFSGRPIITVDPVAETFECTTTGYTAEMAMVGVVAEDPEDGTITDDVLMSGVTFPLLAPDVYTILYDVIDSDGTPAAQQQRVVTIEDTLPPDLTLVGAAEVYIECGQDTYIELGAVAEDLCDGSLPVDISGDVVDEMVIDTYVINYTAEDGAGHSVSISRTVHVVDTTGPMITLLGDDPVILDGGALYEEAGVDDVWDACEGDIDVAQVVIDDSAVNTSSLGAYAVSYSVDDSWGNETVVYRDVIVQRVACALIVNAVADDVVALPGEEVKLRVQLDPASCSVGTVNYEWLKRNGDKAEDFSVIPGAPNAAIFTIDSATEADSGIYRCDVSDDMYTVSSPEITLLVGTGLPVAGMLGLAMAAAAAALAGVMAVRKRH